MESEYNGLANAAVEVVWVEYVLQELSVKLISPAILLCDNLSTASLAANPVLYARTKRIEIDHHFIRDKVMEQKLTVQFTPQKSN